MICQPEANFFFYFHSEQAVTVMGLTLNSLSVSILLWGPRQVWTLRNSWEHQAQVSTPTLDITAQQKNKKDIAFLSLCGELWYVHTACILFDSITLDTISAFTARPFQCLMWFFFSLCLHNTTR